MLHDQAGVLADRLRAARHVKVVSHIDADGLTSAAVAVRALQRAGKSYDVEFLKSLKPHDVKRLKDENPDTLWFTDLGAGAASLFGEVEPVITDHHVPTAGGKYHLNCHFAGEDGARYLSGSTTSYLVARALDRANRDMASVAVVGCIGDLQDVDAGRLIGMNQTVVQDAAAGGFLAPLVDTRYFGRETRGLAKMLQFADDPCVPGVTGRHTEACAFLESLGVPLHRDEQERKWGHLSTDERRRVMSAVAKSLLTKGYGAKSVRRLVGEVYVLRGEKEGEPVRDAKEFATLLNSTARYGEAEVGLAIALGERGDMYARGLELLKGHRANLVAGIQSVRERGLTEMPHLQWFDAGATIRETIVGIVAGMMYNAEGVRKDLPILAFADCEGDASQLPGGEQRGPVVKVSGRAGRGLVGAGLDLSEVMRLASAKVGGAGGGHAPAAGATIPRARIAEFLDAADRVIEAQLAGRRPE
ncbi:MAG TPA: DHH family phosphoesterase [Candidatus Thermoplasmatota archaeon]|nr:DHH family phosphoesterase [Candidatus Thermoplasmatota archaeon]